MQQLMAVLPPYSSHALPDPFKELMLNPSSEIIDFYPSEFAVDVKGKRFAWLGEVLLPLIEPDRLKAATNKIKDQLTAEEKERNERGKVLIFKRVSKLLEAEGELFEEVQGKFTELPLANYIADQEIVNASKDCLVVYSFEVPEYKGHESKLLKGVVMPKTEERDVGFQAYTDL
jgi:5'-3' exonuclease